MSTNPYPPLPHSKRQDALQNYATHASVKASYSFENGVASSVITLTPDTTVLEIAAIGAPAVMRWVRTADTQGSVISAAGGNFEHVITTSEISKFAVPIETTYQAPSSLVGANIVNGLYRRVAIKSIGIASVMLSEF